MVYYANGLRVVVDAIYTMYDYTPGPVDRYIMRTNTGGRHFAMAMPPAQLPGGVPTDAQLEWFTQMALNRKGEQT